MADTKKKAQDKYRESEKYLRSMFKSHLKRKYGLSIEDYEGMVEAQQGCCRICGGHGGDRGWITKRERAKLFVDHCHETGKVRGLLCHQCNAGLGMFRDSPNLLTSAISYLKENDLGGH